MYSQVFELSGTNSIVRAEESVDSGLKEENGN